MNHNKKRNVGLLVEWIAKYLAKSVLLNKDQDLTLAKSIFEKHFHEEADLLKEYKLFEVLWKTKLTTKESAIRLIENVKSISKTLSQKKLDEEKTHLIHDITKNLGGNQFFNEEISGFKDYATIQHLLNHWRGEVLLEDLSDLYRLEERLLGFLTTEVKAQETKSAALQMTTEEVNDLVLKVMSEKFNKKYSNLKEDQRELLQLYAFSSNKDVKSKLGNKLKFLRESALKEINFSLVMDSDIKGSEVKLKEVKTLLESSDLSNYDEITDNMMVFYVTLSSLREELKSKS